MTQELVQKTADATDEMLEPGNVVKFTQRARFHAFGELTDNGTNLTKNLGDTMQLLRDMDQSALTTRKLNIEEKVATDGRATRENFDKLTQLFAGRNPYEAPTVEGSETPAVTRKRSPIPEGHVPPPVKLNPGEDAQGEQVLSIANYITTEE